MRSMRPAGIAALLAAAVLLDAGRVAAKGPFPRVNQIVLSPSDANLVIARATYGILLSHDRGTTWSLLCLDSLGLSSQSISVPVLGLTAGGAFLVGLDSTIAGLSTSGDTGCNWSCVGGALAGQGIADVVVRPDAPHTVLALTSTNIPPDAGGGTRSQVFESMDDGATWVPLGVPLDSTVRVGTMGVAKTDPERLYVSGVRGYGANRTVSLLVSTDRGATWVEHALPQFDPGSEDGGDVAGVDPTNADRVYLRSAPSITGGRRRLFVTADGGQSFTTLLSIQAPAACCDVIAGERLSLALSPDGAKIFVGNPQGGLSIGDRASMTFAQVSPVDIHCLATRAAATGATELWACSDEYSTAPVGSEFDVGVSTDEGATFTPKMATLTSLCGPIACSASDAGPFACGATANASQCGGAYDNICQQIGNGPNACGTCRLDAGAPAPDGAANSAAPASRAASSACGCSVIRGDGAGGLAASGVVVAGATLSTLRRRSRRKPTRASRGSPLLHPRRV
jgi:hypothetical protein